MTESERGARDADATCPQPPQPPQPPSEARAAESAGSPWHPSAIVDPGARVGEGTRIWHFCHVMSGAVIGRECSLGQGCFVASGAKLGNRVRLQNHVSVFDGVTLADDVFCGPSTVFTNVLNPRSHVSRKSEYRPTRVEAGASLGANVTVVCGTRIGSHAMLGAGAVVTRDVPAHGLWVGNPARPLGWVSRRGLKLEFDAHGRARCPESGERYRLDAARQLVEPTLEEF